jgi:hypothetical protein
MVRRTAVVFVLALVPISTAAEQVFKCVGSGAVSYQSAPCEAGQAAEKAWEYADPPPPPDTGVQRMKVQPVGQVRERKASVPPRRRRPDTSRTDDSSIGRCDRAKAHRDRKLYELGLRKSMRELRSWDGYVAEACRL